MRQSDLITLSIIASTVLVLAQAPNRSLSDVFVNWSNHPAIKYRTQPTTDPVAELNRKLQAGEAKLQRSGPSGYLRSVLDALQVPLDSQMMVFVKDSVQMGRISRDQPRSLFFNDVVSVGWVRGGFIELASQDPHLGVIFYTLEEPRFGLSLDTFRFGSPAFTRRNDCLMCHYN